MKITFKAKDAKDGSFYDFPWDVEDTSEPNWIHNEWLKLRQVYHLPESVTPVSYYTGYPEDAGRNNRLRDSVQQETEPKKSYYDRIRLT